MTIGPTGSSYSQMPKSSRTVWLVPRRIKELFVVFALACVAVVAGGTFLRHWSSALERAKGRVEADDLRPDAASPFQLAGRGGGTVDLSKLQGKLVLVNFWASWCAPCRDEEPSLDRLARTLDPASLEVVAVSVDDDWPAVDAFFGKKAPTYRVALDPGARVSMAYGTSKFPESYLVDTSGRLQLKFVGPRDWMAPDMLALLEGLGARRVRAQ